MTEKEPQDPVNSEEVRRNRATSADKVALGIGAAAAIGIATGLLIARQSGKALRRYIIRDDSALKEYWQFDYQRDSVQQTRYFHGTEAAVQRRIRHLNCDVQELKKLDKSRAEYLISEQKTHIIEL
jgi:gas vesicle protein